jgi:hypothetical protein
MGGNNWIICRNSREDTGSGDGLAKLNKQNNMNEPKTFLSQARILVTDEFLEKNKLSLRSPKEVFARIKEAENSDYLGFAKEVLMDYADFGDVKHLFKDDYVKEIESGTSQWKQISDLRECAQEFLDYMNFAWGKAEDQRGISASRSVQKLGEWLWLMNREDLYDEISRDDLYNPYGAPALISVCEKMDIPVPKSLIEFAKHPC